MKYIYNPVTGTLDDVETPNLGEKYFASAETDALKDMMNEQFGPGTIKYGSEIPQPEMKTPQAIYEFSQRNPAANGGMMRQNFEDGGGVLVQVANLITKLRESFHVALAAFDLLVDDDLIEPLRTFEQPLSKCQERIARRAKRKQELLNPVLCLLDSLGNLDLLLPSQQRDLTHLLEIHPDRIIKRIILRSLCFGWLLSVFRHLLNTIHFSCVNHFKLHALKTMENFV